MQLVSADTQDILQGFCVWCLVGAVITGYCYLWHFVKDIRSTIELQVPCCVLQNSEPGFLICDTGLTHLTGLLEDEIKAFGVWNAVSTE